VDAAPAPADPSPAERYAAARRRARTPRLTEFAASLDFALDEFQVEACAALESDHGVLVAAPTGAGKTVVGEFAVHLALTSGRKAFYTTPIKALSNQKYADLVARYGEGQVGLLTGDTSIDGDAPVVVMTTEVLRNMLYADSPTLAGLGYVVMDEVHYLADRFRGPVWEEVILQLPQDVRLACLSATVSNAEEFGDWLATVRGGTDVVVSERRPVPLGQHLLVDGRLLDLYAGHVDPTDPGTDPPINPDLLARLRSGISDRPGRRGPGDRRGSARPSRRLPRFALVDVLDRAQMLPAIVFVFSRAGCGAAVDQCVAAGVRLTTPAEQAEILATVERRCAPIPPADLAVLGYDAFVTALRQGVAAHHAGLLPLFKETVEELFSRGLVKVVFATETLALGINMPARCVVLDSLVKWDGSAMTEITPGEYTQLTGRAGRRGIDTEGHAVVLAGPGTDPVHVAGLASRRLYPLRSSFVPTSNMAVNLVAQVGRTRARDVLETSFAQYQADRAVVGLARTAQANERALADLAASMRCDLGDFAEYATLRAELSATEKGERRVRAGNRRARAVESLHGLVAGDVVLVPAGRRQVQVVVLDPGPAAGFDGPQPAVLTTEAKVRRLTAADVGDGVVRIGRLSVPRSFNPRAATARRALAGELIAHAGRPARPPADAPADEPRPGDQQIAELRRRIRAHPCHRCPDREEHARWATRHARLAAEQQALTRRIAGRAGSIATVFDRVVDLLLATGYLVPGTGAELKVSPAGTMLRRLYAENDLLLAQCLREGVFASLDAAGLAAAISSLVYRSRRDQPGEIRVPGGPGGHLGRALDEVQRTWAQLADLSRSHGLQPGAPVDLGLVEAVHRWAVGRSLQATLSTAQVEAGDFVRWVKQVVDLLGQVALAAPSPAIRATAQEAIRALRRGVVAYASV
jgi:ATP-dependent RNA helicase HelY